MNKRVKEKISQTPQIDRNQDYMQLSYYAQCVWVQL